MKWIAAGAEEEGAGHMSWIETLRLWRHILLMDLLRYAIPAGLGFLVAWVWMASRIAHRRTQLRCPRRSQIWMEVRASLSTVFLFSLVGLGTALAAVAGHTRIYTDFAERGAAYALLSFAAIVVLHDAYFYWTHRLLHLPGVFERVHRIHHLSTSPTPWAAYAFHPAEAVVQAGVYPLIVTAIPAHPSTLFAFLVFMIIRNVIGHLGYELHPRWFASHPLTRWMATTTHHDLHHRCFHGNYGLYFTWWDDLIGTTREDYPERFAEVTSRGSAGAALGSAQDEAAA